MRSRGSLKEAQGEGYLASVSDLMAGLIFVFVITLAVFAYRLAEAIELQEKKVEQLESAEKDREYILTDIARRLRQVDITVEVVAEQGVLRLTERGIRFPSGKAHPKQEHEVRVGELARVIGEVLPCFVENPEPAPSSTVGPAARPAFCSSRPTNPFNCEDAVARARVETLLIEGHTDSQPVRQGKEIRFRDNLELSSMRAAEVFRMMSKCEPRLHGLRNRENLEVMSVSGYGDTRLLQPKEPRHEANRRIDLRFLMKPRKSARETPPAVSEPKREVQERYEG